MKICLIFVLAIFLSALQAKAAAAETIKAANSKCHVKSTGGDKPKYVVYKFNKSIYQPSTNEITKVLISPSGKYIALSASGNLLNIELEIDEYGIVIVNCLTEKVKGYRKGEDTTVTSWFKNDKGIIVWEAPALSFSDKSEDQLP